MALKLGLDFSQLLILNKQTKSHCRSLHTTGYQAGCSLLSLHHLYALGWNPFFVGTDREAPHAPTCSTWWGRGFTRAEIGGGPWISSAPPRQSCRGNRSSVSSSTLEQRPVSRVPVSYQSLALGSPGGQHGPRQLGPQGCPEGICGQWGAHVPGRVGEEGLCLCQAQVTASLAWGGPGDFSKQLITLPVFHGLELGLHGNQPILSPGWTNRPLGSHLGSYCTGLQKPRPAARLLGMRSPHRPAPPVLQRAGCSRSSQCQETSA